MAIIKVFGDLHIENNPVVDEAILKKLDQFINKGDIVVFLGDVFSNFNIGASNRSFYNFLAGLDESSFCKTYILEGNHDFSQGRNAMRIVNHFASNVRIIPEYDYVDIDNIRFHFYNYFKKIKKRFQINDNKNNILFSHYDLIVDKPPKEFKDFIAVYNGHIHDYSTQDNCTNLGAFRKVRMGELEKKRCLVIDTKENLFKIVKFDSPVNIEQHFVNDIEKITIDKPTILKVMLTGLEDSKLIDAKIKSYDWYDENLIVLKYQQYLNKETIDNILQGINEEGQTNIIEIFKNYIDYYVENFKADVNKKKLLINLFLFIIEKLKI